MILKLLKNYKKEAVLSPLLKMLEAVFELFVPLVIARLIDEGIGGRDTGIVIRCAILLFALALIGLLCSVRAQYYAAKAAIGACTALRSMVFKKLESLSFSQLEELGTDTMITRITSDVNQVQNGINMTLRLFMRSPFIVFGAVIMAMGIDRRSSLIFLVTVPLLAVVVYGIMVITLPMYRKVQSLLDTILSATRENLTGVRVIRAFGMEETEKREFNEKNSALNAMQKFVGGISALMNPVTFVIVNTATLCLLYTGAVRVDEGIITRGQVVALVNYMSQILVELVKLANLIVLLTRAMSCSQRINSVLMMEGREEELMVDEHPFINEDEPADGLWGEAKAGGASVEFKNVWFAYHDTGHQDEKTDPEGSIDQDERYALKDVSFSAGSGEIIGVIGGTGSGKSTIACLIPGFFYPDRGQVLVDGKCTEDYGLRDLRASVGIALQKSVLFSGTIRENLLWGSPTATDDELVAALKSAQAWEFVKDRRGQLDAILSQGGRDLSGGQKQRLNIARALVGDKQIVILDDSSSALDYATDAALKKEVRSLSKEKGTTVFIISQRTASISHADRIIVLDEGRVAGTGTHDELLESCPEYREIHESQTH